VESEATGPNNAAWSASTAMSEIVVAPSATATARSTSTRPGSWRAPERRSPLNASVSSPLFTLVRYRWDGTIRTDGARRFRLDS
jgi:hypothetical protein